LIQLIARPEAGQDNTAVTKATRRVQVTPFLTWPYGYSHNAVMKTIAAGKFKDICLQTLDEVAASRRPVLITKRGRPVAKLVPVTGDSRPRSLSGSVVAESGDPFSTGEVWDADRS
jgi:antitoxin (DNA-binding transcriptional repressor) of toxin-antitoxin stability system